MSTTIPRDTAIRYLKLARENTCLFSTNPNCRSACIMLQKESFFILSTGITQFPTRIDSTPHRWKNEQHRLMHAEEIAICNVTRIGGISLDNSIAIITHFPCFQCAKLLVQSGIKTIVTMKTELCDSFKHSIDLFVEVGIELILLDKEEICIK